MSEYLKPEHSQKLNAFEYTIKHLWEQHAELLEKIKAEYEIDADDGDRVDVQPDGRHLISRVRPRIEK